MSPAVRNGLLLLVLVVVIGLAGFFLYRGGAGSSAPSSVESQTHWIDVKTGKVWHLSAREREAWDKEPNKRRRDPKYDVHQIVYFNSETNAYTICGAEKDAVTGEWYALSDPEGNELLPPSEKNKPPAAAAPGAAPAPGGEK